MLRISTLHKKLMTPLLATFILGLTLATGACGGSGGSDSDQAGSESRQIAKAICDRITSCDDSLTLENCETSLSGNPYLGENFDIEDSDPVLSLNQAQSEVDAGNLSVNNTVLIECLNEISEQDCENVTYYADPNNASNNDEFSQELSELVPDACAQVFEVAE